ncbi:C4-type Zn-finger protein [Zymobacter palmae]|uniref:C4-type Zn-finger protein n=1 Tax=Zymobacter palmae TaxID=33074 RepID=A0A348HDE1_9GAMM|nr:C4-type Zn-finger protein [Zymobacter palmae]
MGHDCSLRTRWTGETCKLAVEGVSELLDITWSQWFRSAVVFAASAHRFHEVAHVEARANIVERERFSAMGEH